MSVNRLYKYNDRWNLKTTMDIGEITPIYWNVLNPGEKIKHLSFKNLTRMVTPIYPTLDSPKFKIFTFAVPLRLLNFSSNHENIGSTIHSRDNNKTIPFLELNYEKYLNSPIDASFYYDDLDDFMNDFLELYFDYNSAGSWNSLLKKFGFHYSFLKEGKQDGKYYQDNPDKKIIKIPDEYEEIKKDTLFTNKIPKKFYLHYLLAYWKIYDDFFKLKDIENFSFKRLLGLLTNYGKNYKIVWDKEQKKKFDEQVKKLRDLDWRDRQNIINYYGVSELEVAFQNILGLEVLNSVALGNTENDFLNDLTFAPIDVALSSDWNKFKKELSEKYIKNKGILNNKQNTNVFDILVNVWNKTNQGKTAARLISYTEFYQSIQQVVNQAKGDTKQGQSLGEIGGMSVTLNSDTIISNYEAQEHEVILSVAIPTYKMGMLGNVDMQEWGKEPLQFNPNMSYVQEPVDYHTFNGLKGYQDFEKYEEILGYSTPFDFYRHKKDVIAGEIQDNWSNWTYVYKDNNNHSNDNINTNFLKIDKKPFKDTLVSPDQDAFICEFNFDSVILRAIKPKSVIEEEILNGD